MRARALKVRLRSRGRVDEDELRIVEGADALLNLAGITTSLPKINNNNNNVVKQPTTAQVLASVDQGLTEVKVKEEVEDQSYENNQHKIPADDNEMSEVCFQVKQEPIDQNNEEHKKAAQIDEENVQQIDEGFGDESKEKEADKSEKEDESMEMIDENESDEDSETDHLKISEDVESMDID